MKKELLRILCCPICKADFQISITEEVKHEIKEGELICSSGHKFPIIRSVPRLLVEQALQENKGSKQVNKSFGDKWKYLPAKGKNKTTWEQSFAMLRNWVDQKYGYEDKEDFKELISPRNYILDAGCGLAREAINFSKYNSSGMIVGLEFSDCADEAYENCKNVHNIQIVQGDIMNLPFKNDSFDYIFSEGVIHHTYSTEKALEFLSHSLQPKGEIAIYVYKKKAAIREFTDDYIRDQVKDLSLEECYKVCEPITKLGKALSDLNVEFEVPEDIPVLGIQKGKYNLQRFFYYNMLKCFWNNTMSYEENVLIGVDWFHPVFAWRQTPEQVREWCKNNKIQIIHEDICGAGITIRGIKE